jgi:hypothetical protein
MISQDAAESNLASYWQDQAELIDSNVERSEFMEFVSQYETQIEEYGRLIAQEAINRLFDKISKRDNQSLAADAVMIAFGFTNITSDSLEEIGEKHGVTKQAVSKELTFFRDLFRLRSLGAAKTESARESSREAQLAKRATNQQATRKADDRFRQFFRRPIGLGAIPSSF